MVKFAFLPLLALLTAAFSFAKYDRPNYQSFLLTENNARGHKTVIGINPSYESTQGEIRVYSFDNTIDEISDDAFKDSGIDSFVLSREITHISDAALEGINKVYFTGSIAEFEALGLSYSVNNVHPYSVDEGFIYYWNSVIRPTETVNICNDVSNETFGYVYGLYKDLIPSDLEEVDKYVDVAGAKIGDSMKELIRLYASEQGSQTKKDEWNQTGAITLIIVISVVGMTSIAIFFLLKTKKIID